MEEHRVCAVCGYERGFNVFFKRARGKVKICLICPCCGQAFDIGWATASIKTFKTEPGLKY